MFCTVPGRMGVDLLIDPVSLGWYRYLQVLRCVVTFISKIQTKIGTHENISSRFCSEMDLEKVFFLYESRVIRQSLKPEQIKKFECIDCFMYYRSRFMEKKRSLSSLILTLYRFLTFTKYLEISQLCYLTLLFCIHTS